MKQPESRDTPVSAFMLGDCYVDPDASRVLQNGQEIRLEPRVMDLLVYLASRPGHVFSRNELEANVWAGAVVSYAAISKAVIRLRKALNDDPASPRYVETIPRRGYRLIAKVERPGTQPSPDVHNHNARHRLLAAVVVLVLIVAGAGILLWQSIGQNHGTPDAARSIQQSEQSTAIEVRPLRNISGDAEDDYFAAGLTSDLVTDLSKISNLMVVASRDDTGIDKVYSGQSAKDNNTNIKYILSGDVAREGDHIRINIRLEDVRSGRYLWTERYERELADIFLLQDEITTKIVNSLAIKISKQEKRNIAMRYTTNVQAYDYFLKAQSYLNRYTEEGNRLARENYLSAISLDQTFARAHAGLALTYALDYRHKWESDVEQPLKKAQSIVQQIQNMNSELPEVYWILSYIENIQGHFEQGLEYARRSLQLEPGYADAHALLTGLYTYQGNYQQAIASMHRALKLNPDGGQLYYLLLGRAQYFAGDYENAAISLRQAYDRNPSNLETLVYRVATHYRLGDIDEASWVHRELALIVPRFSIEQWLQAYPLQDRKKRQQLIEDFNSVAGSDLEP